MAVITISRELGSEGDLIAEQLSRDLGYKRVDKEILSEIAREAGVDVDAVLAKERSFTQKPKLVSSEMTSLYKKQPGAFRKRGQLDDQTYAQVLAEALERFAQAGEVIIVGRGGQMVLKDWPQALHVRLFAPLAARVARVIDRFDLSDQAAEQRIKQSDEQKRQYIRYMHRNADWSALKHYHLAIDTARVPPPAAVQLITIAASEVGEQT